MDKDKPFLVVRYDEKTGTQIESITAVYPAQEGNNFHKEIRYSFENNGKIVETKGLYPSSNTDSNYGLDEGQVFSKQIVKWQHFKKIIPPFTREKDGDGRLPIFTLKPRIESQPQLIACYTMEPVIDHLDKASWRALETQYAPKGLPIDYKNVNLNYATNSEDINGICIHFNRAYNKNEQRIVSRFFSNTLKAAGVVGPSYFSDAHKLTIICVLERDSRDPHKAKAIVARTESMIKMVERQFHNEIPVDKVEAIAKELQIDLHSTIPTIKKPPTSPKSSINIH